MTAAVPRPAIATILGWYDAQGRSLPFRGTKDPYAILVSEVMAQQTQIDRVGPAWAAFLETFPSFEVLAGSTPAAVLRAWAGLGYNRRALNLWRCARVVVERHGGRLPSELDALTSLPGIGPYTARAVAAIAFGRPVGPVDTNVRRVLGRIAGVDGGELQTLADSVVPSARAADWTHALMDVGATFCRSTRPRCAECPARPWCRYAADPGLDAPQRESNRRPGIPFRRSTRWLRGRILEQARAADDWVTFDGPLGDHDRHSVRAAVQTMGAEGLLEVDATSDAPRARLPLR